MQNKQMEDAVWRDLFLNWNMTWVCREFVRFERNGIIVEKYFQQAEADAS